MTAVYRRELGSCFHTMSGYLFCAFLLFFGGFYTMIIDLQSGSAQFEYVLYNMGFAFLFATPILTMRSFAEERHQRTDQLLYALPLTLGRVALGKYLALVTVLAIPTAVLSVYPVVLSLFGGVSFPTVYSAVVGFFLMGCALLAMGMFLSSLTDSQPVAAVLCFGAVLLSYYMVTLASVVPVPALGTLLTMLSPFERFYSFVDGVFDWTGVVYFLSVAALFLLLTVQGLEKRRWKG